MDELSISQWLELTRHSDPKVRRRAVVSACSCHVKANHAQVWDRVIAMAEDPDSKVRSWVAHNLVDGSPSDRNGEVLATLERMQNDPDPHSIKDQKRHAKGRRETAGGRRGQRAKTK
jgi:hypothetical protein